MTKSRLFYNFLAIRADLYCGLALAMISALIWCYDANRWTARDWAVPITYLSTPDTGDVMGQLAGAKAASHGAFLPFTFVNVPQLGAPYVGNWNDFPTTEKPLLCLTGLLSNLFGIFAGLNVAVMLGYVLSTVSFYAAARLLDCSRNWSAASALAFAFSRYAYGHGAHHLTVAWCWHVPLCLVVCGWVMRNDAIGFRDWRFKFAAVIAFVAGMQNVYYTNIFAQLLLFGGLLQWWRQRNWRAALPAVSLIGIAAAAFILMNANTFVYHLVYGPNPGAVVRPYKWLEIYGLKIVDLLVPPPDHPLALFANFGAKHIASAVLPPGELPPTGYIGLAGIASLGWLFLVSLKNLADNKRLPLETWQILWILLYSAVGGVNGLFGSFGFMLFRATTRYSIVVLCIVLLYAVKKLSTVKFKLAAVTYGLAAVAACIALWDQMPPVVSYDSLRETERQVASDWDFTKQMEQRLPPNGMVFQIPVMEYPETPTPGVGSSDHFRPYLYSDRLRFSFGSDKGRPREKWQMELSGLSLGDFVGRLERYGFGALYINRNGYPDKADGILKAFKDSGYSDILESERKDLACIFLKPSFQPVLPSGGVFR